MWSVVWRLRMIMGLNFRVVRNKSGYIFFKDMKGRTHYSLYYVGMSAEQILEIARIVNTVFSKNDRDNRQQRREVPTRNLNSPTDSSKKFVARVLNLNRSPLHKFLLLTSGAYLSSPGSDDLLATLAEAKSESCGDLTSIFKVSRIFETLQETYVLPGVTESIQYTYARTILNDAMMRHSVETIARLLVFVASKVPNLTLSEHMRLKDNKAFAIIEPVKSLEDFSFIEEFIARKPGYSNLGHRLTATELSMLRMLMKPAYSKIPEDFLFNRVTALTNTIKSANYSRLLSKYLSTSESLGIDQSTLNEISEFMTSDISNQRTTPILYAAIAELVVHRGRQRTLDVLHVLNHLSISKSITTAATEATVLLILEAIESDNDDMPFSWAAQLSEHAWVLNSSASIAEELALKV